MRLLNLATLLPLTTQNLIQKLLKKLSIRLKSSPTSPANQVAGSRTNLTDYVMPTIQHDFKEGDKISLQVKESAAFSVKFEHVSAIILQPGKYKGEIARAPNGSLWVEVSFTNAKYTRTIEGIIINPGKFTPEKDITKL